LIRKIKNKGIFELGRYWSESCKEEGNSKLKETEIKKLLKLKNIDFYKIQFIEREVSV